MKRLHKTALLFMTLAMLLSCVVPSFAEGPIPATNEYSKYVDGLRYSNLSEPLDEGGVSLFEEMMAYQIDEREYYTNYEASLGLSGMHQHTIIRINDIIHCSGSNGIKIDADCYGYAPAPSEYDDVRGSYDRSALYAYISDRETGKVVSCQFITSDFELVDSVNYGNHSDIYLNLPEFFDAETHSLSLFIFNRYVWSITEGWDVLEYRESIKRGKPCEIDLSTGADRGSGDVNGDGTVNLMDAADITRKVAEWNMTGFDEVAADTDLTGDITLTDAAIVLKRLAGHTTDDTIPAKHADKFAEIADEMYAALEE